MRNRFKNKWYGKTGKLGFTLIEVLVAIAILALLAVPLAQSMITSAQLNSQSKNVGSASDMAQTVAESMQATQLGTVLTEINGYNTNSVGYEFYNSATGEGYSFLNNALQGYAVDDSYEVMLLCPGCSARLSTESLDNKLCDKCSATISDTNVKYVPVKRQNSPGVTSDADVTSSIKTRTTKDNIVRTYFTGNADDTYDFVLKNIHTDEANFDVLVHVEPEQSLQIADISSMSSSDLVNIVQKKTLDNDVAETFFQAHQMYCMLNHTSTTMTIQDFQNQMTRQITIDIRNDAIRDTTVITIKAVYTAPEGTVDTADKYITKTVGSFTTNSTAELADGVYFYYYPLRTERDVIIVNNPDALGIKVYFIVMEDGQTGAYNPHLQFSDLTPTNAASTTTFCSNLPESDFAELPAGVTIKTLSNTSEQQTLYSMDVKVYTHKDSSFDADGVFIPDDKYLIIDTNATLLDSSEKFDVNVDAEFGNPIPDEGEDPDTPPGEGDDDIDNAPNRGYAEAGGQNFVYSGDEYDVTIIGGLPGGGDMGKHVEWSGETKGTNAGTYIAYAKPISGHTWPNGTTGKRQISWTISRKPASIITMQDAIYDSLEHLGYDPAPEKTNYVTVTGEINKTSAGHYTIYVTPEPNYAWLDDGSYNTREMSWTISPKPVVLTWKTGEGFDTWQYDGNEHFGQCEVAPDSLAPADRGQVKPNIRDNRIVEVGKILAKVTSLNNPNYALPTQGTTHNLTVYGAAVSTVTMKEANNGVDSLIYNGQEQTGLAFSEGVAITGVSHAIDAGKYTLTATPLPGYAWDAAGNDRAPRNFDWEILQREVTIKWGQLEWDYDGITHSTTCDITDLVPDTICEVEIANNAILDAGEQPVTATLTNKNYKFKTNPTEDQKPNKVLKVYALKDSTYTINDPVIYDGQTHNWGTGSHIQITGILSQTEAGKYQVTITPTKNHTWADGTTTSVTKTWEIKNAELATVSWDNYCYTGLEIIGVTNKHCDWGDGDWKGTQQKTYTVEVTPSKNYAWANNPEDPEYNYTPQDRRTRVITWKIAGNTVIKPDPNHALLNFGDPILVFEYNGQVRSPHISTIDGTLPLTDAVFQKNPYYKVTGQTSATNACQGNCKGDCANPYVAVISLKDPEHSSWATGGTEDIVIKWHITKRQITLYTIPHNAIATGKPHTWYENDEFDGQNKSFTGPASYTKIWDGMPFTLKLKLASNATVNENGIVTSAATDGDIWLTKDVFIQYDYDYQSSVKELTPLAKDHTISFKANPSPNIMNDEARTGGYAPDFNPVTNNTYPSDTYTCDKQTEAGVYWYCVTPTIKAGSQDVTVNYDITFKFSYLMIDKASPSDPGRPIPVPVITHREAASTYNGLDQTLFTLVNAPDWGWVEYLWEGYTYSAESSWTSGDSPIRLNQDKKSLLPRNSAWSSFTGTGFTGGNNVAHPEQIKYLQGYIDWSSISPGDGKTGVVRGDCPYWSTTIPNATIESNGNKFSTIGTYAGQYIVYYRFRGDSNHGDYWDSNMYLTITVDRANNVVSVKDNFDKCYNQVSQTVTATMQENPNISYTYNTSQLHAPTLSSTSNINTTISGHRQALATSKVFTLKSNGTIGTSSVTIQAAATENYNQSTGKISVTCRDHLKDGLRDSLNHLCSGTCDQSSHPKHSNKTYEQTCTEDGNYHYDCLECGNEKNVLREMYGHNWVTSYKAPALCVSGGYSSISCTRCGAGSRTNLSPRYGSHTWDYWSTSEHRCINKDYVIEKYYLIVLPAWDVYEVTVWKVCGTLQSHGTMSWSPCCYKSCGTCGGGYGYSSHSHGLYSADTSYSYRTKDGCGHVVSERPKPTATAADMFLM